MKIPSRDEQQELHRRILNEEPDVRADIFIAFMDPITAVLRREGYEDDPHGFAIEAIVFYFRHPRRYDSSKAQLLTFLTHVARRRAQDQQRSATSELQRLQRLGELVELKARAPNIDLDTEIDLRRLKEWAYQNLEDPGERRFLLLMWQGESSTERLAEALGKSACTREEQESAVKKCRDRLLQRLKRFVKR